MNHNQTNHRISSTEIFTDIERRIKNKTFTTKEEIEQKMPELLGIYDGLNQTNNMALNMENYRGVGLENQNLIIAKQEEHILKTMESPTNLNQEFNQIQNELVVNNQAALTNADIIFNHMANYQKEELKLISLSEAITKDNLDIEILQKIKFFISNKYINPYSYKIDIENGIFYNTETSEVLEVRKDEQTNQYQIYKGSEKVYGETLEQTTDNEMTLKNDIPEEEMSYDERSKTKPKIRVLRPGYMNNRNAAFSKINFILLMIGIFTVSIAIANILIKLKK